MADADTATAPLAPAPDAAAFAGACLAGQATRLRLARHQVDFLPGAGVLAVTFEPAAAGMGGQGLERPVWGQAYLQRRGHAVLGVKRVGADWYRSPDLHRLFRRLQAASFFAGFERVIFYGPSMGGYAALAFAACAPGCTVLALHPQSTLAPDRIWFDQRFAGPKAASWQGDFVDGVDGARAAARVYVCYDPHQIKDRLHAQRLPAHNRVDLRLPFAGHTTAQALNALGLLGQVFDQALAGTLDETGFRALVRQRQRLADYQCRLGERGVWWPRRERHLTQALAIDPQHARARQLLLAAEPQALLAPAVPVSEAPGRDEPAGNTRRAAVAVPKRAARWPMGMVTAPRVPLIYLNLPKSASTTIQNHLLFIATGRYADSPQAIHQNPLLRRSREDDDATHALIGRQIVEGSLVFTFVRDPGRRAYACFNEKIMQTGPNSFVAIRHTLERDWGLRPARPDVAVPLDLQRENFAAFLRFVEANLAGDTEIRRDPHWCSQGPMLVHYRQRLKIDLVGKVENFAADMALALHKAGVRRIPDVRFQPWRHPAAPFSFDEVLTPELQSQLDRIYAADYKHLGYRAQADGLMA
jgi:Sulfotransferase family